jgi:hypothetical protein
MSPYICRRFVADKLKTARQHSAKERNWTSYFSKWIAKMQIEALFKGNLLFQLTPWSRVIFWEANSFLVSRKILLFLTEPDGSSPC